MKKTIKSMAFCSIAVLGSPKKTVRADDVSWKVGNASGTQAVISAASDGYTKATGMANHGERIITTSAVSLDGITVYLKCDNYTGQPMGWGFVGEGGYAPDATDRFNTTMRNVGDWYALYYQYDHVGQFAEHNIAFKDSGLTDVNYGMDSATRFYAFSKSTDVGYAITFTKMGNVWKLSTVGLTSNYQTARHASNDCYVSASYIPDTAYISTWVMDGTAANFYMKVTTSGSGGGGDDPSGGGEGGGTSVGTSWTISSGSITARYNDVENYTHLYNVTAWGSAAYFSEKVALDGLQVDILVNDLDMDREGGVFKASGAFYAITFGASQGIVPDTISSAGNFTASMRPFYGMQSGTPEEGAHCMLTFRTNHNPDSAAIASATPGGSTANLVPSHYLGNQYAFQAARSVDGNGNQTKYGSVGYSLKFEKEGAYWKITTSLFCGEHYYDDDKAPVEEGEVFVAYVSNNYFANVLDGQGKTYLYYFGDRSDKLTQSDSYVRVIPAGFVPYHDPDDDPAPTPETDPMMEYYDSETGDYIGSCFMGVSTNSLFVALGVIGVATVALIIRKKRSEK